MPANPDGNVGQGPDASPPTLRIFISSPGDVIEEREKAKQVIAALQQFYHDHVALVPVLWEELAIPATASFQEGIDRVLAEKKPIDIALFILWRRLGTPLSSVIRKPDGSAYLSGTEREFDLMVSAFEKSGRKRPFILAYTRRDNAAYHDRLDPRKIGVEALKDLAEQWERADLFIEERFKDKEGLNLRAYHTYREPLSFAQHLFTHLRQVVDQFIGAEHPVLSWGESPYRSLEAFDVCHSPIFCGRDDAICDLLQRLRDQEQAGCAFACIVGASGSGKSSLARAGIAATLTERSFDDQVKEWRVAVFLPSLSGGDLFLPLAHALAREIPELGTGAGGLPRFADRLENNHQACTDLLETAFAAANRQLGGPARLLLVVDQLEELWTDRHITAERRETFLAALEALARSRHVAVIATLRSDFYQSAQMSETFLRMKGERGHFDLAPPGAASIQELIVLPARRAGVSFQRDERTGRTLDQIILEDAMLDPSSLPLLQYALTELYDHRDRSTAVLTFAAYQAMGRVEGALGRRAEEIFAGLPDEARNALDELLPLVVSVDPGGERNAVRRRSPLAELTSTPARRLLTERLTSARFLTADLQNGTAVASLSHEALLRRWDKVSTWIEANRELLRMRSQVEQSEKRWEQSSHAASLLLPTGLALEEARRLLLEAPHLLSPSTVDYIKRSIERYLSLAIESGHNLAKISEDVERKHPAIWRVVVAEQFRSELPENRRHVASLIGERSAREFQGELVQLVLSDPHDRVRKAAAQSLVLNRDPSAYQRILDTAPAGTKGLDPAVRDALAQLLAVSDLQPRRMPFADWFAARRGAGNFSVRLFAHWIRLRSSLHVFLLLVIPAMILAVAGAASVKWLPSAFNYSCVQSNASWVMGIFYSGPAGIILGGGIAFGLTLYRRVFGREYDQTSTFRPFPAIAFGAGFGLLSGLLCAATIAQVYSPEALHQIGWIKENLRPRSLRLWREIFIENRCGFAFPLTSIGLGIAVAIVTNSLRASRVWPQFLDQQTEIVTLRQLGRVIKGIITLSIRYALPIPILVPLFALFALLIMEPAPHSPNASAPQPTTWSEALFGGLDEKATAIEEANDDLYQKYEDRQKARRTAWKTSLEGRALGLFGDALSKMAGGYMIVVGIGLGIVILRHGVKIEPQIGQR